MDTPRRRTDPWTYLWLFLSALALVVVMSLYVGKPLGGLYHLAEVVGGALGLSFISLLLAIFVGPKPAWVALIVIGLLYSQAEVRLQQPAPKQATASGPSSVPYTAPNCEFSVSFPQAPALKKYSHPTAGEYEEALYVSESSNAALALRTDCVVFPDLEKQVPVSTRSTFLKQQLETYAYNNGLTATEFSYPASPLGTMGELRGVKVINGVPVTYKIVTVMGASSLITVYAGGTSSTFPQPGITAFVASLSKVR